MFKLSLNQDGGVFEYALGASELLIGRQEECDIHLDSSQVSRRHARLFTIDGAYWIEDLKSSNGTLINDELIRSAVQLQDGDQISVGGMKLHRDRRSGQAIAPHVSATVLDRLFSEKVGILSSDTSFCFCVSGDNPPRNNHYG